MKDDHLLEIIQLYVKASDDVKAQVEEILAKSESQPVPQD